MQTALRGPGSGTNHSSGATYMSMGRSLIATRRAKRLMTVLAAAVCLMAAGPDAAHAARPIEKRFAAMVNEVRASSGMGALSLTDRLSEAARRHSRRMAAKGTLFHSDLGRIRGSRVSENVGWGGNLPILLSEFMDSPTHAHNILGDFQQTGIGIVRAHGKVWLTQTLPRLSRHGADPARIS